MPNPITISSGTTLTNPQTRIAASLTALPANTRPLDPARTVVLLVLTSPGAAIQR